MNVLHTMSSVALKDGGTVTALVGMAGSQADAGLHVTVVATLRNPEDESAAAQLAAHGVQVVVLTPATAALRNHPDINPSLRKHIADADLVHIHGMWEQIQHAAAREATRQNKPYVISPHGMLDPWSLSQSKLKKQLYMAWRARKNLQNAAALHFTTTVERDLTGPLNLKPRAIVEPLGVDLENLTPPCDPALSLRNQFGLHDGPILLFFGRLHHKKRPGLMIEALAALLNDGWPGDQPTPQLAFVGPASEELFAELKALAESTGVTEHVTFTGMLTGEARRAALQTSDLFCLPSQQENFGLAVAEALAAGCPVFISDQVNIHGQISDAGVGWVSPPELEPWTKTLRDILTDPEGLKRRRDAAKPFAVKAYDWSNIARHWADTHYPAVLG